jgi:hypothetical protein
MRFFILVADPIVTGAAYRTSCTQAWYVSAMHTNKLKVVDSSTNDMLGPSSGMDVPTMKLGAARPGWSIDVHSIPRSNELYLYL